MKLYLEHGQISTWNACKWTKFMIDSQPWQVQIINSKLDLSSKIAHLWTHWFPVVDWVLWSILNNWAYHKCLFVRHSSTFAFVLPIWTPILEFLFRYGRFKIFIQVQPKSELNVDWSELDRPLPMQLLASPDSLDHGLWSVVYDGQSLKLMRVHSKIRNMLNQHGKLFTW